MDQKLHDLLKRVQSGEQFFRPENESDEANVAFKSEVNRLRELKDLEYILLKDNGFIKNYTNGKGYYNIVGPCEITYKGEQALIAANEELTSNSQAESLQKTDAVDKALQTRGGEEKASGQSASSVLESRLQTLSEHIAKEFDLLKEYEDELRLEDDPLRRARYEKRIERLKTSAQEYARQYQELESRLSVNESGALEKFSPEMSLAHKKLDALIAGQIAIHDRLEDFGRAILNRYDAGEQTIIKTIVERIDEAQAEIVESILDSIEQNRLNEGEMLETLEIIQKALVKIEVQGKDLIPEQEKFVDAVNDPQFNVKHKLKMTIPLVPLLLNYETEFELGSGLNLGTAWKNLKDRFSKK